MLAAGADQLVAEEALANGSLLAAVLPFYGYEEDFKSEDLIRYRRLLGRCVQVIDLPYQVRSDHVYKEAGRSIVDRCDSLVAIWDGYYTEGEGGTSDIVNYAMEHGKTIHWIDSTTGTATQLP
jgi:hypothetical protein